MIAGCIDKMRTQSCDDCSRQARCASLLRLFDPAAAAPPRRNGAPAATRRADGNPFLAFLGFVAKAVETFASEKAADRADEAPSANPQSSMPADPRPGAFCRAVEAALDPLLADGPVRIASVARTLRISRQTLYRRLKVEGTTFEQLLDRLRRRLALRLIRDEGVAVKEAAWRLGFSDPAAFSRAFKRWTGISQTHMRGGNGASPAAGLS